MYGINTSSIKAYSVFKEDGTFSFKMKPKYKYDCLNVMISHIANFASVGESSQSLLHVYYVLSLICSKSYEKHDM